MTPVNVESIARVDANCDNCRCNSSCAPHFCCTHAQDSSEDQAPDLSGDQTMACAERRVNKVGQDAIKKSKCCVIL